uniref:ORF44 n=1 Tax=Malaco herpesvirus 2 TaxID=3031798 RepID=A0AA48SIJ3_9VIRU|nr:TPA_asm: ORF44 [Malaco herpesvirus 2]
MELKKILGSSWVEHIRKTDNALSLNNRIELVNHYAVIDTFVKNMSKINYLDTISKDSIYNETMALISMDVVESRVTLDSLLLLTYAEYFVNTIDCWKHKTCKKYYGCSFTEKYGPLGHPSQNQHWCLEDQEGLLELYFSQIHNNLDKDLLLKQFAEKIYASSGMILLSNEYIKNIMKSNPPILNTPDVGARECCKLTECSQHKKVKKQRISTSSRALKRRKMNKTLVQSKKRQ